MLEKREPSLHCWWECKLVLCRTVWRFPGTKNKTTPYDPAILLLGVHPKEATIQKDTGNPIFTDALFVIDIKQAKCPSTAAWIMKMWSIYTMEY